MDNTKSQRNYINTFVILASVIPLISSNSINDMMLVVLVVIVIIKAYVLLFFEGFGQGY
jgi:uncharacterized membrane protein